jgi:hypothetical protein
LSRPLAWRFQVTGGYSAESLRSLLALQLRASPQWGVYPPVIEPVSLDDPASPLSAYLVTLYVLPRQTGRLYFPVVRLPWYDAAQSRMMTTELPAMTLTVFDPRWERAGRLAGWAGGVLLLGGAGWQARRIIGWRMARRRGLERIRRAPTIEALSLAVRQFSLTRQPVAPSLGEWARRWPLDTVGEGNAASAVRQLEQAQFGGVSHTLDALKRALVTALAGVRPGVLD